jgi:hypothetical protein
MRMKFVEVHRARNLGTVFAEPSLRMLGVIPFGLQEVDESHSAKKPAEKGFR